MAHLFNAILSDRKTGETRTYTGDEQETAKTIAGFMLAHRGQVDISRAEGADVRHIVMLTSRICDCALTVELAIPPVSGIVH